MEESATLQRRQGRERIEAAFRDGWLSSPWLFLRHGLKRPLEVCSLFPSRPSVGRALVELIAQRRSGHVLELGAGTGAVTQQLLASGMEPANLTAVELDPEFTRYLSHRFHGVEVLTMPAEEVAALWRSREREPIGAVVSTLPLKLFDTELQRRMIGELLTVMEPEAPFVQLTYRLSSPVHAEVQQALGLRARRARVVLRSIPPAFLWEYRRG